MRIRTDSSSAQRLRAHGVTDDEMEKARIFVFNQQAGAAITLPIPLLGPTIFIKKKHLVFEPAVDGGEPQLEDGPSIALLRHEFCHVGQILEWGSLMYMARQVWARVRSRNLYAKETPEEAPCYQAEREAREHYPR